MPIPQFLIVRRYKGAVSQESFMGREVANLECPSPVPTSVDPNLCTVNIKIANGKPI